MQENVPPYHDGILKVLQWSIDKDVPLKQIPFDINWCQSKYKCYYGGVLPPQMKAKDMALNFISSAIQNTQINDNPNRPPITRVNTDSFFIVIVDIKNEENIIPHLFFYDGKKAITNIKKRNWPIQEFYVENIGEFRKPWEKINKEKIEEYIKELTNIFNKLSIKVKNKQGNEIKSHENNCKCDYCHDSSESAGNN